MLNSDQLEAFLALSRIGHFTRAAKTLHITQSALSQRIGKLEEALKAPVFVRQRGALRLTDEGAVLLRYCQMHARWEEELLGDLQRKSGDGGTVRIAAYSSVLRSVVMPALEPVLTKSPEVQVHFFSREMSQLPEMLRSAEADLIVLDHRLDRANVEEVELGTEENVLAEGPRNSVRRDVYLDHDPDDTTTERFLRFNRQSVRSLHRSFFDDVYGILEGVRLGYGRAVVSRHLVGAFGLHIVPDYKPLSHPVVLHHFIQPFYSKRHKEIVHALRENAARHLGR